MGTSYVRHGSWLMWPVCLYGRPLGLGELWWNLSTQPPNLSKHDQKQQIGWRHWHYHTTVSWRYGPRTHSIRSRSQQDGGITAWRRRRRLVASRRPGWSRCRSHSARVVSFPWARTWSPVAPTAPSLPRRPSLALSPSVKTKKHHFRFFGTLFGYVSMEGFGLTRWFYKRRKVWNNLTWWICYTKCSIILILTTGYRRWRRRHCHRGVPARNGTLYWRKTTEQELSCNRHL